MSPKTSVLVVANRTADSTELIAALRQRAARSPARFRLLVPAVPRGLAWAADSIPRREFGSPRSIAGSAGGTTYLRIRLWRL